MNLPALGQPQALGLFGGTFDPPHHGHAHIAHTALAALPIASVRWIPSGDPGHRSTKPRAASAHRLAMVAATIAHEPRFTLDSTEITSAAPTFTVPMLERLRGELGPDQPLVLISGADSFLSVHTWLRWRELFTLTHIAVAARPGSDLSPAAMAPDLRREFAARIGPSSALAHTAAGGIALFDLPPLDVSATDIRARLAQRAGTADLLPAAVLAYIESQHLYAPHTL